MKKIYFTTSVITTSIMLVVVCMALFLILSPENPGQVYYFNMITSVVVCVLFSLLISLPQRRYTSIKFLTVSWTYLFFFLAFTLVGIFLYYKMIASEFSGLDIKLQGLEKINAFKQEGEQLLTLNPTDQARYDLLKQERNIFLLVYYGAFLIITCLWSTALYCIYRHDSKSELSNKFIDKSYEKSIMLEKIMDASHHYITICKSNDIYPESNYKIERLHNELESISSDIMGNVESLNTLQNMTNNLTIIVNDMDNAPKSDKINFNQKIRTFVDENIPFFLAYKRNKADNIE